MTIEKVTGVNSGGYRITDMIDGRYVSRLYLGYTRAQAIAAFIKSEY
jgi:hypothetical protein